VNNALFILCLPVLLAGCTPTRDGSQPRVDTNPSGGAISRGTGAEVLRAANAFLATLSSTQRSSVLLPYTQASAVTWSNLPVGVAPHNGVQLGTLSGTQLAAALAVVRAATGTAQAQGYDQQMQIRAADDVLNVKGKGKTGPSSFSSGNYGSSAASVHPAALQANRIRALSKSNLARPYICRFNSLTRVTWPSTCPLLQGDVMAPNTAAVSFWMPLAKRSSSSTVLAQACSIQVVR